MGKCGNKDCNGRGEIMSIEMCLIFFLWLFLMGLAVLQWYAIRRTRSDMKRILEYTKECVKIANERADMLNGMIDKMGSDDDD